MLTKYIDQSYAYQHLKHLSTTILDLGRELGSPPVKALGEGQAEKMIRELVRENRTFNGEKLYENSGTGV